ncbi:GNAT family N-acetyltransferase [Vibrio fluminensis]|uniref:GNAT family N-acetyltransferase n=1 Tax=Vibrio fluminensis TaxID=2783614 RepID=UPI0032B00E01
MLESDWDSILRIQAEVYHDGVLEELEVLKSKSIVSPTSCFVCETLEGDIAGYLLSHPWDCSTPPKLFEPLTSAKGRDQFFIHDMAVSARVQGKGVGRLLIKQVLTLTEKLGMKKINLVAVQGADSYWARLGFVALMNDNIRATYGNDAVLMQRLVFANNPKYTQSYNEQDRADN